MNFLKYISAFLTFTLLVGIAAAQLRIGTHFQTEIVQRNAWNPAAMQDVDAQIMLFGFQPFIGSSGFSLKDALVEIGGTDSLGISIPRIYEALDAQNIIRSDLELDWFGFAIALKDQDMQIGLNFGSRVHSQVGYDRDMLGVLLFGNAAYIDQTIEVGPQVSMMAYSDLGLSAAKRFGEKFQVGLTLHYLNGALAINTPRHLASLYTAPEYYQLDMELDYELNAALPTVGVLDSIQQGVVNTEDISVNVGFSQNHGFALDAGAMFRPLENLEISAGIQGLGAISWRKNAQKFVSRGNFYFDGVEPQHTEDQPLFERLVNLDFAAVADSIMESYEVSISDGNFSMSVPMRLFVAANYSPVDNVQLGATLQRETFQGVSHSAIGLYGGLKFNHAFSVGLSYGRDTEFGSMVGLHSHANLGPLQGYLSLENFGALVDPRGSKAFAFRVGTNILIGKHWIEE